MKVKVNENCIGCGYCVSACEKYFEFVDGYSHAIKEDVDAKDVEEVTSVAEGCPVAAIEVENVAEGGSVAAIEVEDEEKAA